MADLLFSNKAVEDLTNIWNYTIETWSEAQADKYYTLLVDTCRQIADSPHPLGKEYTGIRTGLFGYRIGKHIVFYRAISEETIESSESCTNAWTWKTEHENDSEDSSRK